MPLELYFPYKAVHLIYYEESRHEEKFLLGAMANEFLIYLALKQLFYDLYLL